jgi:hypothetical protein
MSDIDLTARVKQALGERDFHILMLEEKLAQRDARIAELERRNTPPDAPPANGGT